MEDVHKLLDFPEISNQLSLDTLKGMKPGHYKLKGAPSLELLKSLLLWGQGSKETAKEAGLTSIRGVWVLVLSNGLEVPLAEALRPIAKESLISFDLHTHPVADSLTVALMPSFGDISTIPRTLNNRIYIATSMGISIVSAHPLKGSWFNPLIDFQEWAAEHGRPLETPQYRKSGWHEDFILFLKEEKMFDFVPWTETGRIEKILREGDYDPLADPQFKHSPEHLKQSTAGEPNTIKLGPLQVLEY